MTFLTKIKIVLTRNQAAATRVWWTTWTPLS